MEESGNEPPPDISLRPFRLSDVDAFSEWAMDDRVSHFFMWETFNSWDDCLGYMASPIIPHPWCRVICIEDRPIGLVLMRPKESRSAAELAYELAFRHWGKGIATMAVKMAISAIFREWPELERVESNVDLEKAGFEVESLQGRGMRVQAKFGISVFLDNLPLTTFLSYGTISLLHRESEQLQ